METAQYVLGRLKEMGVNAWCNPSALTVVFPAPSLALKVKWQLATEDGMSHLICMPGISRAKFDEFLADYALSLSMEKLTV